MSGSNSFVPNVSNNPEAPEEPTSPVSMTVHSLPLPDARRTFGRLQMLLVLACCAAPVVASYFTYFVIKPQGGANYSELITPPRAIPEQLPLVSLTGESVKPAALRGQWILAVVANGACDASCENNLLIQRQLRETLGREKERVDKVWFLTDDAPPSPLILQAISAGDPTQVLRVPRAELSQWLQPAEGQLLDQHIYVIDPMGQWMMRAPPNPEPERNLSALGKFKKDIERLLRASASWDQPGR